MCPVILLIFFQGIKIFHHSIKMNILFSEAIFRLARLVLIILITINNSTNSALKFNFINSKLTIGNEILYLQKKIDTLHSQLSIHKTSINLFYYYENKITVLPLLIQMS